MKPVKKVILGLENTSIITIPIERIHLLEINGADALTNPIPSVKRTQSKLKIMFKIMLDDYSGYSLISAECDKEFIFNSARFNLVDITVVYDDNSEKLVGLPWQDDTFWFENKLEALSRPDDDNILIEVKQE